MLRGLEVDQCREKHNGESSDLAMIDAGDECSSFPHDGLEINIWDGGFLLGLLGVCTAAVIDKALGPLGAIWALRRLSGCLLPV